MLNEHFFLVFWHCRRANLGKLAENAIEKNSSKEPEINSDKYKANFVILPGMTTLPMTKRVINTNWAFNRVGNDLNLYLNQSKKSWFQS